MTDLEIRKDIIETARRMLEKGLVQGTGGNFSVRCEEGFIITPSGMDYATLTSGDLPKLSPGGAVLEGERRPSIEKELHREVYLARRDVCAVVHTHSVYATAAAAMRLPLPVLTDNQAVLFGGPVPVAEYAPIGTPELARGTARALGDGADGQPRSALCRSDAPRGGPEMRDAGNIREDILPHEELRRGSLPHRGAGRQRGGRPGGTLRPALNRRICRTDIKKQAEEISLRSVFYFFP